MVDKKTAFPMLPVSHWWALRKKFKQSIPGTVTASYVASVLNMKEASARANILPYLQQLGITDEDGNTLDRARQWRDDAQYAKVCDDMRKEVYAELNQIEGGPSIDVEVVKRWFANHTGAGQNAVGKMTSLYSVIAKADPEDEKTVRERKASPRTGQTKKVKKKTVKIAEKKEHADDSKRQRDRNDSPGLHINIQVHVSSDATPDQIDQIFASMAKHIYSKD